MNSSVPIRFTCHDIHGNGCETILDAGWNFCPQCGRKAGGLHIVSPLLLFRPGAPPTAQLILRHAGQRPVTFGVRLPPPSPDATEADQLTALRLLDASGKEAMRPVSFQTLPGQPPRLNFRWASQTPPPHAAPLIASLEIISDDGAPQDPFATEAKNRHRQWDYVPLEVRAPTPPRLRVETELCLFGPSCRERTIFLFNEGDALLPLRPIVAPPGYQIEPQSNTASGAIQNSTSYWTLGARERRAYQIKALAGAPTGSVLLSVSRADGKPLGQVKLLNADAARVEARTRYIVGVDFGTTGTSVWVRDGRDDRLAATPLHDANANPRVREDPLRFPTLIYVRLQDGHETGFFIGYKALHEYHNDGGKQGFLVSELKSLLRADEEPFLERYGANYSVDILLRRYLQTVKKEMIDAALGGGQGASVGWNFSLPVLDSHSGGSRLLFERQKSRLEKAIRAAGFLAPNCTLQFFTEPFCAAVYLLLGHGNYQFPAGRPPREGDWVCVFDSGGGTTDVVLGRLWFQGGELRFEEVATLGGYRSEATQEVATFGGESLTRRTAIYLSVWQPQGAKAPQYDFLKYADFAPRDQTSYERLQRIARRAARDERAMLGQDEELKDDFWMQMVELLPRTDRIKRQIAELGTRSATTELRFPPIAPATEDYIQTIEREEFDTQVVNPRLMPLAEEMRRRVFQQEAQSEKTSGLPAPVDVTWIFGVGGNCRVKRIEDWLLSFFPSGVQNLEYVDNEDRRTDADRMLAVAGGAAWASKARRDNAMPYALWIEDQEGRRVFEITANDTLSEERIFEECVRDVPPGQSAQFHVQVAGTCRIGGVESSFNGAIGSFDLSNADYSNNGASRALSARFAFERHRLVVRSDQSGEFQEIFSYMV